MELRTEKPDVTAKNYLSIGTGEYRCGNSLYLIVTPVAAADGRSATSATAS